MKVNSKIKLPFYALLFLAIVISSCQKEAKTELPFVSPYEYYPMTVGNSWVYASFDELSPDTNSYKETVTVEKDTLIGNRVYYKLNSLNQNIQTNRVSQSARYVTDSLHYLIDKNGMILFSTQNFTDTLQKFNNVENIYDAAMKMEHEIALTNVPAGNFMDCINYKNFITIQPHFNLADGHLRNNNRVYAKGIGLIRDDCSYLIANKHTGKWLVQYTVH